MILIAVLFLLLVLASYIGLFGLFKKAGQPGWAAFVPIYGFYILLKICGRPGWWLVLCIIPLIGYIIIIGTYVDFFRSYGKFKIRQQIAGFFLGFIYLPKWAFDTKTVYLGPSAGAHASTDIRFSKASAVKQWILLIATVFLVVLFMRSVLFETYSIPTPSMERTLLIGDLVYMSKLSYGTRLPITPVALPFMPRIIPFTNLKSYWNGLQWPYRRLPGLSKVKRGDIVVFNYPMDADSPLYRPIDKRENYIKRCQGLPGDTLKLIDQQVYVNSKPATNPPEAQTDYVVTTTETINPKIIDGLHINYYEGFTNPTMTVETANILKGYSNIRSIIKVISKKGVQENVFPYEFPQKYSLNDKRYNYGWNVDNFGPIIIPKKGWTVKLDSLTFPLYERAIEVYENNKLEVKGNDIFINGIKTDTYTFKLNYYWMMGDNRHDTLDSRYWGFLPEDHLIGKLSFILFSYENSYGIHWDRMFREIN